MVNNNKYIKQLNKEFNIPHNFVSKTMIMMHNDLMKCTTVETNLCRKVPATIHEYKIVARNRVNRRKPILLANKVFAPIIFNYLFTV